MRSLGGEDIKIHILPKGVFAEDFVELARWVHIKVIALGLFFVAVGAVIHVNVPAGIRAVVASSYRIPKLGEVDE